MLGIGNGRTLGISSRAEDGWCTSLPCLGESTLRWGWMLSGNKLNDGFCELLDNIGLAKYLVRNISKTKGPVSSSRFNIIRLALDLTHIGWYARK